ncbi:MAG: hypothetical protein WBP93_00195 [Pyrinomonadaceae bacterium]
MAREEEEPERQQPVAAPALAASAFLVGSSLSRIAYSFCRLKN